MRLFSDLLDLMPSAYTETEKYATLTGLFLYDTAPETMALLCKHLRESVPEEGIDLFTAANHTWEQWTAMIKEILCGTSKP